MNNNESMPVSTPGTAPATPPPSAAAPAAPRTSYRIWIVRTSISSASAIEKRTEKDDMTEEITFRYDKEKRERIVEVRGKYRRRALKGCISFFNLQCARTEDKDAICAEIEACEKELQAIDPTLRAKVAFLPVPAEAEAHGELYRGIVSAIQGHFFKTLLERLPKLAERETLPERSRLALLSLVDEMKGWNVLDDPNIAATVDALKKQFEHGVVKPVLADIARKMDALKSEGAWVEL